MSVVTVSHIRIDDRGIAWIEGTKIKVIEVVMDHRAAGLTPEEMVHQHYGSLSLAQIHGALSYYFDHQAELDAEIERQATEFESLRTQSLESPGRQRLRAQGKLP
jgi:uncharacterized protein (DUF433 family)